MAKNCNGKRIDACRECEHYEVDYSPPTTDNPEDYSPICCNEGGEEIYIDYPGDIPKDCKLPEWEEKEATNESICGQ